MNGIPFHQTLETLKQFVNDEHEAQFRQVREVWALSPAARVAAGEAIADIEVVAVEGNRALLRCGDNQSKFRPPEALRLNHGDPSRLEDGIIRCTLQEDRGHELVIGPGFGVKFTGLKPSGGWMLDRDVIDTRKTLTSALESLEMLGPNHRLLNILSGSQPPTFDAAREAEAERLAAALSMNSSQREAFIRAYAANDYYLIQGPPGTGKTWVLAQLAAALARSGQRVLITAFTHRAINNALRKIQAATGYPQIMKIGEAAHADDLDTGTVPNYENFSESGYTPESRGLIVGATCFSARSQRLRAVRFDTVLFDEAGQVTLPLAVAGMLSARRAIFIGDHQQMGPVIAGEHTAGWVTRSIFETLFTVAPGTMLDTTYRMNNAINAFPSARFYGGRLLTAPDTCEARLALLKSPSRYAELLDPARPSVFAEVQHSDNRMRAPAEAELAAGLAAEAIACGVPAHEIAVVAPYRAQGRLIRSKLYDLLGGGFGDVVVDTVERMQGQEREMVIVSLTTSDPEHAASAASFYFQPNRLNVAITRPRVKRIVIGSPSLLQAQPADPKLAAWVEHFRALYRESDVIRV